MKIHPGSPMSDCLFKNVRRISRDNLRNRRLRMFADFIRHLSARKGKSSKLKKIHQ